jgi:hypothetical protein
MDLLRVQATISKVSSMARSQGLRLQVDTQEIESDDESKIMALRNKLGWFVFKENQVQVEDIPIEPAEGEQKTPSQRVFNVLAVYYKMLREKEGKDVPTSIEVRQFYERQMEKYIESVKSKLDKLQN